MRRDLGVALSEGLTKPSWHHPSRLDLRVDANRDIFMTGFAIELGQGEHKEAQRLLKSRYGAPEASLVVTTTTPRSG